MPCWLLVAHGALAGGGACLARPPVVARPLPGRFRPAPPRCAVCAPPLTRRSRAAARPLRLRDLRRRVLQARADLVGLDLIHGSLLTLAGLVRPLLQPALHDDPHATLEGLGTVLSR